MRAITSIPRQACLGLIEATSRVDRFVQGRRIPRQACLGLIEAAPKNSCKSADSGIPRQACLGLIEARSSWRSRLSPCGRIPRQACLGLIEALVFAQLPIWPCQVFRGKLASASLKRNRRRRDAHVRGDVFRGKLASASLKHMGSCYTTRGGGKYSEASLPRPH